MVEMDYRNVIQDLNTLNLHVMVFYDDPNAETLEELKRACQQHSPGDTISNLHLRFTDPPLLHNDSNVGAVKLLKFNLENYQLWVQEMRADLALLVWNMAACQSALNSNMSLRLQAAYEEKQLDIIQALEYGEDYIKAKYANLTDNAIRDVQEILRNNRNSNNQITADAVTIHLNDEYPYAYWTVAVYNPCYGCGSYGVKDCDFGTNCWYAFCLENKNIFLLWSTTCKRLEPVPFSFGDIDETLSYFEYRPVLVVKPGNDIKSRISPCVSNERITSPSGYTVIHG